MDRDGKTKLRYVFAILPVILVALAAMGPAFLSATGAASAQYDEYGGPGDGGSDTNAVRDALKAYVANQFTNDASTEYGFVIDAKSLKSRIDSNGDGTYLGEGDDAAMAPIVVDVLDSQTSKIPTTAIRVNWNTTALQPVSVKAIARYVDNHEMAGFTTDVVVYCLTGHTEAAAAGGFGAVAGAGGLGGSSTPKVLSLKWGRAGWGPTDNAKKDNYTNAEQGVGVPSTPSTTYADASNSDTACNGKTGSELVRCAAERALSTGVNGTPVGNGVNPPWDPTWQAIDLRPNAGNSVFKPEVNPTLAIPVNTIFNTGLNYLNPAASPKKIFVGDTQHMAGMIATGAEMLGYDSGFLQWGLANYNKSLPEKYTGSAGYAQVDGGMAVDVDRPEFAEVAVEADATIKWTTDEPATSVVEYSLQGGSYTQVTTGCDNAGIAENCTVLRGSHSLTLSGLEEGAEYTIKVSSFDGMANGSTSSEVKFTAGTPLEATAVTTVQATAAIPDSGGSGNNSGNGGSEDNGDSAAQSEYDPTGSGDLSGSNNPGTGNPANTTGNPSRSNTTRTTLPATGLPVAAAALILTLGAILSAIGIFLSRRIIKE